MLQRKKPAKINFQTNFKVIPSVSHIGDTYKSHSSKENQGGKQKSIKSERNQQLCCYVCCNSLSYFLPSCNIKKIIHKKIFRVPLPKLTDLKLQRWFLYPSVSEVNKYWNKELKQRKRGRSYLKLLKLC